MRRWIEFGAAAEWIEGDLGFGGLHWIFIAAIILRIYPPAVGLNVELHMDRIVILANFFCESGECCACCQILAFKSFSSQQIIKKTFPLKSTLVL